MKMAGEYNRRVGIYVRVHVFLLDQSAELNRQHIYITNSTERIITQQVGTEQFYQYYFWHRQCKPFENAVK